MGSTSFFNLEAVVDDYRIFNTSLTDPQINNLSIGGNGNVLGNAIVVPRLDAVDVSCNGIVITGDLSANDASFNRITANNINGISNLTAHTVTATNYAVGNVNFISASRQGNFRDLEVKNSSNTETILLTGDGGHISINGTLSADTISEKTSANGTIINGVTIKNNNLTAGSNGVISATNFNIGSQYIVSAARQARFTGLEIKHGTTNDLNIHLQEDGDAEFVGDISANKGIFSTNLGVGTTSATQKLAVQTGTDYDGIILNNEDGNLLFKAARANSKTVGYMGLYDAGSSPVPIVEFTNSGNHFIKNGNFGIGTTTPSQKLHVNGNIRVTGDISANDASLNVVDVAVLKVNGVSITQNGSGGASLNVNSDISINAIDAQDASFNILRTSGTMVMGGHILPTSNAQYDLGSAEYKIRHLFLSDNSLWIGDQHKIDVSGGKMRFKKRKTGTGFVPQEILDASANSNANDHINGVIAEFSEVSDADDIKLHHWEAWVANTSKSGVTGLLPHELFEKDDNFEENRDLMSDVKLPTITEAPSDTPATGTMRYDTTNNKLYIYNSGWKAFSPDA